MTDAVLPARPTRVGRLLRTALFWIRRYLPCELAGTATLLLAGTVVFSRTGSSLATAATGTIAETIGFYSAAFVVILREQRRVAQGGRWTLLGRTIGLGIAEFGLIDLLDTLLIRPALLLLGTVALPNPTLGLLAGKLASDVVFYLGAAAGYRLTEVLGLRRGRTPAPAATAEPVATDPVDVGPIAVAPTGPAPDPVLRAERCAELADAFEVGRLVALAGRHGGPLLLLDTEVERDRFAALQDSMPAVRLHYAVKACDHPAVLAALARDGARFDVAGPAEVHALLALGVTGDRMLFSNPIATPQERADAVLAGVRTFVVDNPVELRKAADLPEGSRVLLRLAYHSAAAHIDLSAKFGTDPAGAERLLIQARDLGVEVAGFSFHVGSQTGSAEPFLAAITATAALMAELEERHGVRFTVLDIGGGFPVVHRRPGPTAPEIGRALAAVLAPLAGRLELLAEPGRCVVADAMVAVSRVVGIADRADGRWYYLDDGVYGSWSNVLTEDVHPMLLAAAELRGEALPLAPVTLAGPTCDSVDVIARGYPMPELAVGDLVLSPTMGAYTAVTASRFNGRSPAEVVPAALAARHRVALHAA